MSCSRLAPTPWPQWYAGCDQPSPHDIGRDTEVFGELREGGAVAIEPDHPGFVAVGQPLAAHRHTVGMEDLDDAALAEVVALPKLGGGHAVAVGLDEFGDRVGAEPVVDPSMSGERYRLSDRQFCRFFDHFDDPA